MLMRPSSSAPTAWWNPRPSTTAEEVVPGHHDVVEQDLAGVDALVAELAELARHRVAEVLGHDEQRHPAVPGLRIDVGLHQHRQAVALLRVGDPHLRAVQE